MGVVRRRLGRDREDQLSAVARLVLGRRRAGQQGDREGDDEGKGRTHEDDLQW
jgi:hypothetical protein